MTLDYSVVLPMALTVSVSYGLRRYLCPDSIYTMKLSRRGEYMPQALQANAHLVHHVSEMALDPATVMPASTPIDQLDSSEDPGPPACIVLLDGGGVTGVLMRDWVLAHRGKIAAARELRDVASQAYVTIETDATILSLRRDCGVGRSHEGGPRGDARGRHGAVRGLIRLVRFGASRTPVPNEARASPSILRREYPRACDVGA